jgi:hypothetical protein
MVQPQPQYPQKKPTPLHKGLLNIKDQIDKILDEMRKDPEFLPTRSELEKFSKKTVDLIQKFHPLITSDQKTLLTAVIDLTEIPVMHPAMQRVAFETALKDASNNINRFLMTYF